jgi:hypothetical protein
VVGSLGIAGVASASDSDYGVQDKVQSAKDSASHKLSDAKDSAGDKVDGAKDKVSDVHSLKDAIKNLF